MHHPTDRITHTHNLCYTSCGALAETRIAQWSIMSDWSNNLSYHEQTLHHVNLTHHWYWAVCCSHNIAVIGIAESWNMFHLTLNHSVIHFNVWYTDIIKALWCNRSLTEILLNFTVACILRFTVSNFKTFSLCFQGGVLVAVIHGARTPEIQRTITEQLKQEHKVQEGNAERKEVRLAFIFY